MGYTTEFKGRFQLDRPMLPEHAAYINQFSDTRRMKRNAQAAENRPDPVREAAGLPIGTQGEFFVGADGDASVLEYNRPPDTQPGLWCQWVVTDDLAGIEWNEAEKFYEYEEWLRYICENFLKRWGYKLNGRVTWEGEDRKDVGTLCVVDNEVSALNGHHATGDGPSKNYDSACHDLAMSFIADSRIPPADQERLARELAQSIQCEIELFLEDNETEEES